MAEKILFDKSEEFLVKFFKSLGEKERKSIGLMGGWAVHHVLKNRGFTHPASRDIDIFFDPGAIKFQSVKRKIGEMGFHAHSTFRWVKIFQIQETPPKVQGGWQHCFSVLNAENWPRKNFGCF